MNLLKKLKRNKKFSQYPCEDYLHNALRFLQGGANCGAYTAICWALIKSGAELNEEEKKVFERYQDRFPDDWINLIASMPEEEPWMPYSKESEAEPVDSTTGWQGYYTRRFGKVE